MVTRAQGTKAEVMQPSTERTNPVPFQSRAAYAHTHWDLNNLIMPSGSEGSKLIRHFSNSTVSQLGLKVRKVV